MSAIAAAKAVTGIALGLTIGIAASAAGGADVNPARNVVNGITICVAVSIAFSFGFGWPYGFLTVVVAILSTLRISAYGIELLWSLASLLNPSIRHPIEWDELLIFQLPATCRRLALRLQHNEQQGIVILCNFACNPFQRWAAQRVLKTYLHHQNSPIRSLYQLLIHPVVDAYVSAPVTQLG
ncbi:MAG: hypothetical protein MUF49_16590 [Oculatellaceae cyanobacterium Prado106]|jgi:hypothetical protein|nr:hypothetical protein [Oculatellaceae cyanobacterium Prado106]